MIELLEALKERRKQMFIHYQDMESKMYLTQAEADAKGLPTVQEQIDRYNAGVRAARAQSNAPAHDSRTCNDPACIVCDEPMLAKQPQFSTAPEDSDVAF
jgi:hypothetical protein